MKSNKKRILFVLAILTMAVILTCIFAACDKKDTGDKTNSNDLGVYYEVVGSSLDEKSYIELKSGNVWYDGEDQGTFKINGGNITLYDGDLELMSGTISNGVLTLSFMGETTVYKKSGSMGSGNVDQKAMIKSIQNGKVDGLTVSLEIDNTVEDVDLSGMITTSKDCSWQLYTSRTATSADAIVTKIIVPKNGNNTYYIVVTSADGKTNRTYTLNVWKNYYVTLSFYANGSFYTSEQVLTHTTYGSGPSCSVAGYTFNGWGCDGYYVTESKSFNANLTPLTYTAKFDSNGGSTLSDKTATFNKDLSLPTPYRTGYTFQGWYLNGNLYNDSIKYTYTNDSTFTARWQIISYNVVIKSDNEELGTVQEYNGEKDYNSSVSLSATPKLGCSFVGWFANGTKISTNKTYTINVPAYDVTYVAIFEKDERLANFKCSITENSCVITGVLDKNITTVLIPDYVTGISDYAFRNCTGLTSVTIGGSVTSIGSYAFSGCYRLIEVYNKSTLSITAGSSSNGYVAYYAKNVYKNEGGSKLTTDENGYVIYTDGYGKILVAYHGTNTKLALPSYITKINQYAFYNCTGLKRVTIGGGVTSIGDSAFSGCTGLTTVNWNATACTSAGSSDSPIFKGCSNLATVNIGDNVKIIPSHAFSYCTGLTSIYYTGDVASWCGISGLGNLMSSSRTLYIDGNKVEGELTIPDSVTSIGDSAFSGCEGLTSVTIPDSVTSIGNSAFSRCTGLTSIYYTGDVAGWCGISGLGNLMSSSRILYIGGNKVEGDLVIPDGVTSIDSYAFEGCTGLTSITIPNSVTSIGSNAFYNCTGLTTVNWNATACTSAGSSNYPIFKGCSNLATVNIGDNVKIIPSYAFYNCTGLTSITIPDNVTSIGSSAFSGCSSLESITIPFVGAKAGVTSRDTYQYPFGYIFGTSRYDGGVATEQYYYGNSTSSTTSETYYIPSSLKSVTVTGGNILYGAFYKCTSLTSVTIGNSVTSIGSYAFFGCTGLTSVTIGGGVTSIGYSAFEGCTGLTSVTIPDSVTSIGYDAFAGCNGLTSITIPDSVTSIGDDAFAGCSSLESITIPFVGAKAGVTSSNTYQYPFGYIFGTSSYDGGVATTQYYYGNSTSSTTSETYYIPSSLKSVTVTGGNILYGAFYKCTSLTSVTIPDSVTSIGEKAFYYCTGLTSVTIGDSVTSIGSSAFSYCTGLTTVNWNATACTSAGLWNYPIFKDCSNLATVNIGDNVKIIPSYAFRDCTRLTSVTIGNSVTSIGEDAFDNTAWYNNQPDGLVYAGKVAYKYKGTMPSNTSIVLEEGTLGIADDAFFRCTGLTSVTIPDSVTSIGGSAFYGCDKIQNIYITDIGAWCNIAGLSNLMSYGASNKNLYINNKLATSITIPNGVMAIPASAFRYCTKLTSVTIPDSVTSIGEKAFYCCTGLTSVTIPDRVTSIGYEAFRFCTGLTSVTIPDSVTSIGSVAFNNTLWYNNQPDGLVYAGKVAYEYKGTMPSNTSVVLREGTLGIAGSAFYGCTGLTNVTIPDSVTSIGSSAFYGCTGLTNVTIPDSVTSIGDDAFYGCTGLTNITIPNSVTSIGNSAFSGCKGLTTVNWNATACTSAGSSYYSIFKGCSNLATVNIGDNVKIIPSHAFSYCTGLTSIYYTGDVASWCGISGLGNLMSSSRTLYIDGNKVEGELTIPDGVTSIGSSAFYNCKGLTSVTIPDSVTSIGSYAFYGCTRLTRITFKGTIKQWNAISKGSFWKYDVPSTCKVVCTDGTVSI